MIHGNCGRRPPISHSGSSWVLSKPDCLIAGGASPAETVARIISSPATARDRNTNRQGAASVSALNSCCSQFFEPEDPIDDFGFGHTRARGIVLNGLAISDAGRGEAIPDCLSAELVWLRLRLDILEPNAFS